MKSATEEPEIISVQYCTGYVDKNNKWNHGFNCTGQASKLSNSNLLFCCGTTTHKYCCSTKQYLMLGYAGQNSNITFSTLLTVVFSTFLFAVMLTIIAFVCCKKYWKSRQNLNFEVVDDSLYQNANFLTLNAAQLINSSNFNTTDALQISPSTSTTLPSISTTVTTATSPSETFNLNQIDATQPSINNNNLAVNSYQRRAHHQLIYCEPPPPYQSTTSIHRTIPEITNSSSSISNNRMIISNSNSDINRGIALMRNINYTPNSQQSQAQPPTTSTICCNPSVSYLMPSVDNPSRSIENNQTNLFSNRLLLALGGVNLKQYCVHPIHDKPRKKIFRTLSQ